MAPLRRLALVLLLLLVMTHQGLTAAYLDLRGPAHFHLEHDDDDHDHAHSHAHAPGHVLHHHHPASDASVVTVHEEDQHEAALPREGAGWSGTMLVTLLSADALLQPSKIGCAPTPRQDRLLETRFPGRLERPPRIDLA